MNRRGLVALGLIFVLQAVDVALRAIGPVPVLGICVLIAVAVALGWVATRRQ